MICALVCILLSVLLLQPPFMYFGPKEAKVVRPQVLAPSVMRVPHSGAEHTAARQGTARARPVTKPSNSASSSADILCKK